MFRDEIYSVLQETQPDWLNTARGAYEVPDDLDPSAARDYEAVVSQPGELQSLGLIDWSNRADVDDNESHAAYAAELAAHDEEGETQVLRDETRETPPDLSSIPSLVLLGALSDRGYNVATLIASEQGNSEG